MESNKNSLSMPIAIIIAGLMIAGAVYFSNKTRPIIADQTNGAAQQTDIQVREIPINPVTTKDYVRGNLGAKVVIVEYSDPECPFCKIFQGTMKNLMTKLGSNGTIAWAYRNFPLKDLHPRAPKESEALLCAGKLGGQTAFWDYTDRIYSITPSNNGLDASQLPAVAKDLGLDVTKFNACLSSGEMTALVNADYQDGVKAGGTGTPFSVLITQKAFDPKVVEAFLLENVGKYRLPIDLFAISPDSKKVSISGAMPQDFMEQLIAIIAK